jgi:hypothetical protein
LATRRERVVLELQDEFTTGMARAAAAAALLNRELDSLSKDSVRTRRSISDIDRPIQDVGRSAGRAGSDLDRMSGRMRILADVTAILGPGLVGVGAVGVPAIAGLAAQLGFAVTAAGTAVVAFQGVGDALTALNKAGLDPTQANLEKAQVALERLSPAAQEFVAHLGTMLPELRRLRDVASEGLFPGLTEGLDAMESALPHVQGLLAAVSTELGNIAGDTGESLASERWTPFLDFIAQEAPSALGQMADAAGNTAHAVAELWMATDPINDDFSQWLVNATEDLDRWASGLSETQGFADFMAYLDQTGPKVAAAFGAIANAALQIVEAAAPLSGPVLDGVKALADVISAIADSDLGTPLFTAVAALALFNRTMAITKSVGNTTFVGLLTGQTKASAGFRRLTADLALLNRQASITRLPGKGFVGPLTEAQTALGRVKGRVSELGKGAALLGGLAVAGTGAADSIGLTNTASLALMGTIAGPWGAAMGAGAGAMLDITAATKGFNESMREANDLAKTTNRSAIEAKIEELKRQRKDLTDVTGFKDFFSDAASNATGRGQFTGSSAVDRIDSKLKKLQDQLKVTKAEAAEGFSTDGFEATAEGIDDATSSTQDFLNKLQELSDVLAGRASFRGFEQAIDDFTERQKKRAQVLADIRSEEADFAGSVAGIDRDIAAARKKGDKSRVADLEAQRAREVEAHKERLANLREEGAALKNSLDIGTQAGRDTQAALDNIASTALAVAKTLDPIARAEFLAGARVEFVKAAKAAGLTRDEAQKLADKVLGLSAVKGQPKIVIDANGAWRVISETERRLARMRDGQLKINVVTNFPQGKKNQADFIDIHGGTADGGTIQGSRYPYGDKVLVPLAPGEEVITNRNGEADRWRPLLKRINAGLANGGTVPFSTAASMSVGIDYDRLAQAMAAARPMYGDVHVSGDPTTWRRQMENDRRAVALGGVPR